MAAIYPMTRADRIGKLIVIGLKSEPARMRVRNVLRKITVMAIRCKAVFVIAVVFGVAAAFFIIGSLGKLRV